MSRSKRGALAPPAQPWAQPLFSVLDRAGHETSETEWRENGRQLALMQDQTETLGAAIQFAVGDWWIRGARYGDRVAMVSAPDWRGPSLKTCRNLGSIAKARDVSRRRDTLPFTHHAAVAGLPAEKADRLLDLAEAQFRATGVVPPVRQVIQLVKRERREVREQQMADTTRQLSEKLGRKLYNVILADPPWRFETWGENGMDRAAENHYPTMSLEQIRALDVPGAPHAVLFLWRTAPRLTDALSVMQAWGFKYVTEFVWVKNRIGLGYWSRNQHEVLMVGTRGHPVAPAPGTQFSSIFHADTAAHSAKPAVAQEMIEAMFPHSDRLEMFARSRRPGWASWGNSPELADAGALVA